MGKTNKAIQYCMWKFIHNAITTFRVWAWKNLWYTKRLDHTWESTIRHHGKRWLSFKWSHFYDFIHRLKKVRTTWYSIINGITGKYCSVAFILLEWLHRRTWLTDVNYTFILHVPILTVEMPNYDTYFKIGCNSLSSSANIKWRQSRYQSNTGHVSRFCSV